MNQLQVYENEQFGKIRTIEEDGKVLFSARMWRWPLGTWIR